MDEAKLIQFEKTLLNIEGRVAAIEKSIATNSLLEKPVFVKQPTTGLGSSKASALEKDLPPTWTINSKSSSPSSGNSAQNSGGAWLAYTGVLFFVLAASFFIKLSIDSGWLSPIRQFAGAVLFGLALIASGDFMREKDRSYSSFLPGAGIVVLFMSAYSGYLYFQLYDYTIGVLLVGLIAIASLFLFLEFKHSFFLIVSVIGTYFVPVLIRGYSGDITSVCLYFVFWDILYCICAVMLRQRQLIALSAYLAIGAWQLLFSGLPSQDDLALGAALFQAAQFLIFTSGVAFFSVRLKLPLTSTETWALLPVLVFFYVVEYALISSIAPALAPWISIGFAALIYFIYSTTKAMLGKSTLESSPAVITFIALSLHHSVYLELLPARFAPWLVLAIMALSIFGRSRESRTDGSRDQYWPASFVFFAMFLSEYAKLVSSHHPAGSTEHVTLNFIFFGLMFLSYLSRQPGTTLNWWLLFLAKIQALYGLFILSEYLAPRIYVGYVSSSLWSFFALLLLGYAQQIRDPMLARSAVAVFGLVAVKVLFSDIDSSSSLARVIALVLIGALLYLGGFIWRRVNIWQVKQ